MALLEVNDLTTYYKLKEGHVRACEGVSLRVEKGEALGLVGESASGKTTVALSLIKLLPENASIVGGSIKLDGKELVTATEEEMQKIRWNEISIIFQAAMKSLNPVDIVGDQIAEALKIHEKLTDREAWERTRALFEKVEIDPDRVREYPHEFSGGMRQRAMIAMAIACNPKLVIGDEPTTALDVMVQAQVLQLLQHLRDEIEMGLIAELGPTETVFARPALPYTRALMAAFPDIEGDRALASSIPGNPPNLLHPPRGCRFHERCSEVQPVCREEQPPAININEQHYASCHLLDRQVKSWRA